MKHGLKGTFAVVLFTLMASATASAAPLDYKQCKLIGDINGDTTIDIRDLLLLRNIVRGKSYFDYNSASADLDKNGRVDNQDVILLEETIANIEGAYDFGGMFGACGPGGPASGSYVNPATNTYSCPLGYTAIRASGTPGVDWPVYYCVRKHVVEKNPDYDFGGMFGACGPGGPQPGAYTNPVTGAYTCPPTYQTAQVVGTPRMDWPVFYCYRQHEKVREQEYDFGGVFGSGNPAKVDPGYTLAYVSGTPGLDLPIAFAYRKHQKIIVDPQFTPLYGVDAPVSFTSPGRFGPFTLPADEAGHDKFAEWWYINGHLTFGYGREQYDFMANFFNFRLNAYQRIGQVLFALTDPAQKKYYFYQYDTPANAYSIGKDPLALAYNSPNLNTFTRIDKERCRYKLHMDNPKDKVVLDLKLTAVKPPVPIGDNGYVFLAANEVSAYYAQPRLFAEGTLTVKGESKPVCGIAWIDRQWGDFDQRKVEWEWFSLQMQNNTEVEVMKIYDTQTGKVLYTFLDFIDESGRTQLSKEVTVSNKGYWKSPVSGKTYSSGWEIRANGIAGGITLQVTPRLKEQEFQVGNGMMIWEGSCTVTGGINGRNVAGEGYTELTKTEK